MLLYDTILLPYCSTSKFLICNKSRGFKNIQAPNDQNHSVEDEVLGMDPSCFVLFGCPSTLATSGFTRKGLWSN